MKISGIYENNLKGHFLIKKFLETYCFGPNLLRLYAYIMIVKTEQVKQGELCKIKNLYIYYRDIISLNNYPIVELSQLTMLRSDSLTKGLTIEEVERLLEEIDLSPRISHHNDNITQ